jgi:hypothetical protein
MRSGDVPADTSITRRHAPTRRCSPHVLHVLVNERAALEVVYDVRLVEFMAELALVVMVEAGRCG